MLRLGGRSRINCWPLSWDRCGGQHAQLAAQHGTAWAQICCCRPCQHGRYSCRFLSTAYRVYDSCLPGISPKPSASKDTHTASGREACELLSAFGACASAPHRGSCTCAQSLQAVFLAASRHSAPSASWSKDAASQTSDWIMQTRPSSTPGSAQAALHGVSTHIC